MAVIWKISLVFLSVIGLSQAAECPPHWTFYQGSCYRFFGQRKSWQDAEDHCRGVFTSNSQGHLASIHRSSTNDFLIEMWKTSLISIEDEGDRMWIGLTDRKREGFFTWISDGSLDVPPNVWIPGQPDDDGSNNEDCVDFWNINADDRLGWNDESCARLNVFVCEISSID